MTSRASSTMFKLANRQKQDLHFYVCSGKIFFVQTNHLFFYRFTQKVKQQLFSFFFVGTAYGEGVYFARSASYSQNYSHRGSNNYRFMYIAKVLVGKYTVGRKGLKAPPSRDDPTHPGLLYDSVVDNFSNPSIYVVFLDHQCYPEYLITFK